ncbi:MAG TPA: purine-nucleoside phosphorylase [Terriglobia bacterium]|nr:purine-nucleoside phosphorylase [Terriglobia bacterium]
MRGRPRTPRTDYDRALAAARYIRATGGLSPRLGMILGSGLGEVVERLENPRRLPYASIPHFPRSTVAGHAGELALGHWSGVPTAMLCGRMHLYEGYTPSEVVLAARALALAGIEYLFVTCAAGGIGARCLPGSLMIFSDHLNYQGVNPLVGPEDARLGPRFIEMSEAYDRELRTLARRGAHKLRLKCSEGVYAGLLGPSFETPAEIRALRRLGADAVGMSTVLEVIAARQRGVRVLAVASITNRAAGLTRERLSHQEVLEAGRRGARNLASLFDEVVAGIR